MKLKLITENKKPFLIINYENNEWQKIEKIYKEVGLELVEAQKLFGKNIKGKIYRLNDDELKDYLHDMNDILNDINKEIILDYGYVNLGVLRIIPENNKVKIPLPKYLNIVEINLIAEKIATAIEKLLSTITTAEINIIPTQ